MDSLCLYSQNFLGFHLGRKGHGELDGEGDLGASKPCNDMIFVL